MCSSMLRLHTTSHSIIHQLSQEVKVRRWRRNVWGDTDDEMTSVACSTPIMSSTQLPARWTWQVVPRWSMSHPAGLGNNWAKLPAIAAISSCSLSLSISLDCGSLLSISSCLQFSSCTAQVANSRREKKDLVHAPDSFIAQIFWIFLGAGRVRRHLSASSTSECGGGVTAGVASGGVILCFSYLDTFSSS